MKTRGQTLRTSEKLATGIEHIVAEISAHSRQLQGLQPPQKELQDSAQEQIEQLEQNRGRQLFYPYLGSGLGQGPYVELADGSVKLDFINGIGINILGHSHPDVVRAMLEGSLSDVVMQGNLQPNMEYARLADKLIELASRRSRLCHAWLTTSGSMANENALKMCRQKTTPARKIIAMEGAFAGRTTLMAEISDNAKFRGGLPRYDEVLRVPFYDPQDEKSIQKSLEIFKQHISEHEGDICAFTFELMQGEGGFNVAPREFFVPMLEICREQGIPVWVDEIQTFARTGCFFAFETLGLEEFIDVCTVAKSIQSAATLYTKEMNPKPGLIAGTFAGSSAALAAGRRILEILDNEDYMGPQGHIAQIHDDFVRRLNELNASSCKGLLRDAGGLGLMIAVTPLDGSKEKRDELLKKLFHKGLIAFGCGHNPYRLRFLVPAVVTSEDLATAQKVIEEAVLEVA